MHDLTQIGQQDDRGNQLYPYNPHSANPASRRSQNTDPASRDGTYTHTHTHTQICLDFSLIRILLWLSCISGASSQSSPKHSFRLIYTHTHTFMHRHIGRQLAAKSLAQGHNNLWQEEAGIKPTTFPSDQEFWWISPALNVSTSALLWTSRRKSREMFPSVPEWVSHKYSPLPEPVMLKSKLMTTGSKHGRSRITFETQKSQSFWTHNNKNKNKLFSSFHEASSSPCSGCYQYKKRKDEQS